MCNVVSILVRMVILYWKPNETDKWQCVSCKCKTCPGLYVWACCTGGDSSLRPLSSFSWNLEPEAGSRPPRTGEFPGWPRTDLVILHHRTTDQHSRWKPPQCPGRPGRVRHTAWLGLSSSAASQRCWRSRGTRWNCYSARWSIWDMMRCDCLQLSI